MPSDHTSVSPVTVVIPTYGRAQYLLAAVDSVLSQTRPPREVIVVDDGSPDDTGARVAPLVREGRIRYIRRENGGMAVARNTGAAAATSEYLLFLDDDDLLVPFALEWMVPELEAHPEAGLVAGGAVLFRGDEVPAVVDDPSPSELMELTGCLQLNPLRSSGQVLMRRSAFEALGGWQNRYPGVQDWDLWLRLLKRGPGRVTHRPAMAYRLHDSNMSRDTARMYRSSLAVARAHLGALPPDRRAVVGRYTYTRLRRHHEARLVTMTAHAVRSRRWTRALSAASTWGMAWGADVAGRVALKAHLARRGRWSLPHDDPMRRWW
ncbi:hypothetical protein tb265_01420 [Gemmatimonadetes bacterium T265]|nr:hypothetical protein tb265_01420 [Gemmatimonadetes bacterium T265]